MNQKEEERLWECIDESKRSQDDTRAAIDRLTIAVVGDREAGLPGLAGSMEDLTGRVEKISDAMLGTYERRGLIAKVALLMSWKLAQARMAWAALIAALGVVVERVLDALAN